MSSGVPEHLPGEPVRRGRSDGQILALLPLRALLIAGMWVASLPLWVAFGLSIARWGRPPTTPRSAQVLRYLRWTWTVRPPSPGLGAPQRAWITLTILQHAALTPLWGLAWQVDEALYDLDGVQVRAPVFEISAGRSGSTQLARYLEDDPRLCAPNLLQIMFPYRWLWALSAATIGRWVDRDLIRRRVEALLPPELLDRHEADPFRTDTSDGLLYTSHLHHLAPRLGPEVMVLDLHFAGRAPHNEALWEEDFPDLIDRLARKTLLGRDPRRFFLKGHFLRGASPLARRFPDAVFLAMVREPLPRIRSAINYMRANPVDPVLGPVPWAWWAEAIARTEVEYGDAERAWFGGTGGPTRVVIPFSTFVADLEGTMQHVYRACLGLQPPEVVWAHPPRRRTGYLLDRSLAQVGLDADALTAPLAPFRAWLAEVEAALPPRSDGSAADEPASPSLEGAGRRPVVQRVEDRLVGVQAAGLP